MPGSFTVVAALIWKPATTPCSARRTRPRSFDFLNLFIKATAVKSARFLAQTTVPQRIPASDMQPQRTQQILNPFSAPVPVASLCHPLGKNDINTFQSSAESSCVTASADFDS